MGYFSPYIDAAGLHLPLYSDIRDALIEEAKSIFGQDIYIDIDSADYQFLSAISLKIFDTMQAIQLAYNNRSPLTAVGAALDSLIKLNGITRKSSSYSTVPLILSGEPGSVIANSIASDINGFKWALPPILTISPISGSVSATAICQTLGAIPALPGTIINIVTPTKGWISVTNNEAASLGQPIEVDSQLRGRQAISTANPSRSMFAGTIAAIAGLPGVRRFRVLENPTGAASTDPNNFNLPAHSITAVVEGGVSEDIASVIYNNKSIGCYTNGNTLIMVSDPVFGISSPIHFSRPNEINILVRINIKPLAGYSTAISANISQAIVDFLNAFQIGENISVLNLMGAVMSVMPDPTRPFFFVESIIAGRDADTIGLDDINMNYDEVAQCSLSNITINLVQ